MKKTYICIDLKSFYASVECKERGLDPLDTNLVVADPTRTQKTICLAVSPALKKYGIPGRARLFEVMQKIREINLERRKKNRNRPFKGKSVFASELDDNSLELDFIIATPRMKYYMDYSSKIYSIYLKYVSCEDIYSYSIDEVFCDITSYLKTYKMTPKELITQMIQTVYLETGITATGGIGSNMYLAKVAMDIMAKKMPANEYGVRIAELDEMTYRRLLWSHTPLTDFWRVGRGLSKTLNENGIYTMGDIARTSLDNEELLYKLFGVNAEYLIDHAWGWEPCSLSDVKNYKPQSSSISAGQVLHCPYEYKRTKLVIKEMADSLALDLVSRNLVTDRIVLEIGYDINNLRFYEGDITIDRYGRKIPKHAHGTISIDHKTSSFEVILKHTMELFERIINKDLYVKRIVLVAANVSDINYMKSKGGYEQINLFTDYKKRENDTLREEAENKLQKTLLSIKHKYGKNSILKAMNLEEGGTMIDRNEQIGGHRA